MTFALIGLAILAAIALGGWITSELDLRDAERELVDAKWDRDVALGWAETQVVDNAVVYPLLHSVDVGETS